MTDNRISAVTDPAFADPVSAPRFVILEQDWGDLIAGRVLAVEHGLLATLHVEGVKWRGATETERRIAGFVAD